MIYFTLIGDGTEITKGIIIPLIAYMLFEVMTLLILAVFILLFSTSFLMKMTIIVILHLTYMTTISTIQIRYLMKSHQEPLHV